MFSFIMTTLLSLKLVTLFTPIWFINHVSCSILVICDIETGSKVHTYDFSMKLLVDKFTMKSLISTVIVEMVFMKPIL